MGVGESLILRDAGWERREATALRGTAEEGRTEPYAKIAENAQL